MANPDYATLLPQIQKETDATKKQALIDECYQFKEELTLEERSLFSYFTPDNDDELVDYVTDNPGLTGGNEYVGYVGDYYNEYGQSTSSSGNIFGGPFYIFATGASGFGTGSTGFFYPLYTSIEQIDGPYHIHTFVEYPGFSFYMPNSSMNHAVETRPTDMFEYSDTDFVATPTVVVEYSAPVQQQEEQQQQQQQEQQQQQQSDSSDSEDSGSDTTTQTVAIALPTTDGTTNNYGNITGLTITRATTTTTEYGYEYTTTTYSFTNNTGYSATIESTTLANGAGPTAIAITGNADVTYTTGN